MTVVCISRDTGGTRGLLRVAEEFRKSCEEVFYLAQVGAAEKILAEADESFQVISSAEEIIEFVSGLESVGDPRPCTMLMSWCAEIGRAAVPVLKEQGVLTVLIEDSWWHGGVLDSLAEDGRPQLVCVGTGYDKQRVLLGWPGYPQRLVRVTGWPDFDRYAEIDKIGVTKRVRTALGIVEEWPVALLSVDNNPGIGELCRDLVDAMNDARPSYLVPAWHPGFDRSVPEERPEVEAALSNFKAGVLVDRGKIEIEGLVVAADVIISTYSSLLTVGAALRKQVIAVLYQWTGLKQMRAEMGVAEFPLVELGCAAKASNCGELREILEQAQALRRGLGLEAAQHRTFRLDGQNARRVNEFN